MSLIKKSDVKNHLSSHHRKATHPTRQTSQPDATGFSVPEAGGTPANAPTFADDFSGEHSSNGASVAPAIQVVSNLKNPRSSIPKSAHA
jgi:hypothetical protein